MKSERGSITLESALVLPIFMLFIVFVASIIRISVAEIALNKSVSETTQIIATHAYPATILTEKGKDLASKKISGISSGLVKLSDVEKIVGSTFRELFDMDISGYDFIGSITNNLVNKSVKKKFAENVNSKLFSPDNITVEVELPTSINGDTGAYLGIIGTYKMDIVAPFVSKTITIKKKAYERLWVGGM